MLHDNNQPFCTRQIRLRGSSRILANMFCPIPKRLTLKGVAIARRIDALRELSIFGWIPDRRSSSFTEPTREETSAIETPAGVVVARPEELEMVHRFSARCKPLLRVMRVVKHNRNNVALNHSSLERKLGQLKLSS